MLFDVQHRPGGIAVIVPKLDRFSAKVRAAAGELLENLARSRHSAAILDFSRVPRLDKAGVAAIVELNCRLATMQLAVAGAHPAAADFLARAGLSGLLPMFPSVSTALASPEFSRLTLSQTKALVLCAGKGTRAAPMTRETPKPMLDILGKPILHHVLDHLHGQGIRSAVLNPGHLGDQIPRYFRQHPCNIENLTYACEGEKRPQGWHANPIGSASTLRHLQSRHFAFEDTFVVICGDALIDIDIARLVQRHRQTDAAVTIACKTVGLEEVSKYGIVSATKSGVVSAFQEKPAPEDARSTLANVGVYVFEPGVLDLIPDAHGQDIATDLLPAVLRARLKIMAYSDPFKWIDIGCGRDYFTAVHRVLTDDADLVSSDAAPAFGETLIAPGARVSRHASIDGPCYVGVGAEIGSGARIVGPAAIGAGARVDGGALVRHSLIMAGTHVRRHAIVDNMIAAPSWAIDHRHATDGNAYAAPVPRVTSVESVECRRLAKAG